MLQCLAMRWVKRLSLLGLLAISVTAVADDCQAGECDTSMLAQFRAKTYGQFSSSKSKSKSCGGRAPCPCNHCLASDGSDAPQYTYPVQDPEACPCTDWSPQHGERCDGEGLGCSKHHIVPNAAWGLVFFGVSLSRLHLGVPTSNKASVTHQTKFDFNRLQDRANQYLCKTSDDGWLTGGGNGPSSFLLPNIDSAHMELIHPGTTCNSVASNSTLQPDLSSYTVKPDLVTGATIAVLVDRVVANVSFSKLRVVPTGAKFTDTNEYQLRFDPYENNVLVNGPMLDLYNTLVNEFVDIQVLDKSDPFHMSMCRETSFCTNESRNDFFHNTENLTIQPWKNWAMTENGTILNEDIPIYANKSGGFYLFVTRNRPIIYFAPGGRGNPGSTKAYYVKWEQDGAEVTWANPFGGAITESLVPITQGMDVFLQNNANVQSMFEGLCAAYAYEPLPEAAWSPP